MRRRIVVIGSDQKWQAVDRYRHASASKAISAVEVSSFRIFRVLESADRPASQAINLQALRRGTNCNCRWSYAHSS